MEAVNNAATSCSLCCPAVNLMFHKAACSQLLTDLYLKKREQHCHLALHYFALRRMCILFSQSHDVDSLIYVQMYLTAGAYNITCMCMIIIPLQTSAETFHFYSDVSCDRDKKYEAANCPCLLQ